MNEQQVRQIRDLLSQKVSQDIIAKTFGVAQTTISAIKNKKNWNHL